MPATSDDASVTLVELAPTSASAYDVLLTLDHTEVAMLAVAIVPTCSHCLHRSALAARASEKT